VLRDCLKLHFNRGFVDLRAQIALTEFPSGWAAFFSRTRAGEKLMDPARLAMDNLFRSMPQLRVAGVKEGKETLI